jgi:hypothetical protein
LPLCRFAALPLCRFAALLLIFFLPTRILTAQCESPRVEEYATYLIEEPSPGIFHIVGGFSNLPSNSLKYKFTFTIQDAPANIQSFSIDFGDGQSPQVISFSLAELPITRSFNVDYTSLGSKTIAISTGPSVTYSSQTLVLSDSRVLALPSYIIPTKTQRIVGESFPPVCQGFLPVAKDRQAGTAGITMHTLLNPNNTTGHLVKPLIFVEGIDFGNSMVCDSRIAGSIKNIHTGDFGWDNFITGQFEDPNDPDGVTFAKLPTVIGQMRAEGYDIVFCDFEDGADWIQKNSLALIAVIEEVNRDKRLNNSGVCFPNMVIGASMGGQVAKWALRTMEVKGKDHDSALYVSFDSPQRGANIPLCVQSLIWFNASYGSEADRAEIAPRWNALNRPAAQQLLVHHFNKIEQTNGCDLRQLFATEMAGLGYPTKTRNIATSNGSGIGIGQGYANSTLLLGIKGISRFLTIPITGFDAKLYASGSSVIIDILKNVKRSNLTTIPLPYLGKKLFFNRMVVSQEGNGRNVRVLVTEKTETIGVSISSPITVPVGFGLLTFDHDIRDWDNAPGGSRRDIEIGLKENILKALKDYEIDITPLDMPALSNTQTFIPSISALDIQTGIDNVGLNIFDHIGDLKSPRLGTTPFSAVFFAETNESHVQVSDPLGNFILAQMQAAQVTLQSPLSEPYNYGIIRTIIPSVTVANGGILGVNNNGRTAYVNRTTSEAPTQKPVFEAVAASSCDANIIVQNGGQIQLGAGWNNSGVLRIAKGSVVTLQAGSTLQLNNASQLTIDSAGRLIIDAGAFISFGSLTSRILVKKGGELIINGQPVITGSGHFYFEEGNIYVQNSNLLIQGVDRNIPKFVIGSRASVKHSTNFELKFENCMVKKEGDVFQPYLQCRNSASICATNVLFQAIPNGGGFLNKNFIQTYDVNDANTNYTDVDFNFRSCTFKNAGTIFRLEDTRNPALGTYTVNRDFGPISVEFWSCNFDSTGNAIDADRSRRIEFAHCNLNGCGIISEVNWFLFVRNTKIRGAYSPIKTRDVGYLWVADGSVIDASDFPLSTSGVQGGIGIDASEGFVWNMLLMNDVTIQRCSVGVKLRGRVNVPVSSTSNINTGLLQMDCANMVDNGVAIDAYDAIFSIYGRYQGVSNTQIGSNQFKRDLDFLTYSNVPQLFVKSLFEERAAANLDSYLDFSGNYWDAVPASTLNTIGNLVLQKKTSPQSVQPWTGNLILNNTITESDALRCGSTSLRNETVDTTWRTIVNVNGVLRDILVQQRAGYREIDNYDLESAVALLRPVAHLASNITDTANAQVKHLVEVARALALETPNSSGRSDKGTAADGWVEASFMGYANPITEMNIRVSPNPAHTTFQLELPEGEFTVDVFNALGNRVYQKTVYTEGVINIDVTTWQNAFYLVQVVNTQTKEKAIRKIVVQH